MQYRFRISNLYVQTLPGAGIYSYSKLLDVKLCTRVKKIIKFLKGKPRKNVESLCILNFRKWKFL